MDRFELVDAFVHVDDEDSLTKAAFGCLELLSTAALNEIVAGLSLGFEFNAAPDVTFHEPVDRREPDVILDDSPHVTVLVEAKRGAPTDTRQLIDEYADLTEHWTAANRCLVHITDDTRRPRELDTIKEIPESELRWTNWRSLAAAIQQIDITRVSSTDRRVLAMLTQILAENGFQPFDGFTHMTEFESLSDQLQTAYDVRDTYYMEVDAFRSDTDSQIQSDIEFWRFFRRGVRGGMQDGHSKFPQKRYQRLPKHLWYSYIPHGDPPNLANSRYLENYITLDFNSRTGTIRAGYVVTTAGGEVDGDVFRKTLHENRDLVLDIVEKHQLQAYTTSFSLTTRRNSLDGIGEFLDEIGNPGYDASEWGKRFMLAKTWPGETVPTKAAEDNRSFQTRELPTAVAAAIDDLHELTFETYDHLFYPPRD